MIPLPSLSVRTWFEIGLAVLLVLALGAAGLERDRHSRTRVAFSDYRATQAEAGRHAEKAERAQERTWNERVTEVATDAEAKQNALAVDVAAARGAADRLQRAAAAAAKRGSGSPAITPNAGTSQPGADPLDLLVDVLHRHSVELVAVGEYTDRLRIAGQACERSYDSLGR